jgi:hypothetical protein
MVDNLGMNPLEPRPPRSARTPNGRAELADRPLLAWAQSLDESTRARITEQVVRSASKFAADPRVRSRIDSQASALGISLFFIYARELELGPAELESLLEQPGCDGPDALEILGLDAANDTFAPRGRHADPRGNSDRRFRDRPSHRIGRDEHA